MTGWNSDDSDWHLLSDFKLKLSCWLEEMVITGYVKRLLVFIKKIVIGARENYFFGCKCMEEPLSFRDCIMQMGCQVGTCHEL